MNTQLATSLAEAVSALSLEDFQAFQIALLGHMVQKTPGVAGGHACIRQTRIAVWTLISLAQQGLEETDLIRNFPGLTPLDLLAARIYYQTHQNEIDHLITSHHSEEDWDDDSEKSKQSLATSPKEKSTRL
ncbi:MAG: DUF433 domain-containing protein [Leptolyngbya sp.]|nr:DUF433 domain-containing protein [Leptolyngbya sp.]